MGERVVEVLEGVDWYDHPKWYDVLHWPGTIEEARGMIAVGRRFVGLHDDETARFFEPACGTARHLRVLGGLGHACVGLDMSAAMLGYGRERLAAREIGGRELVTGDSGPLYTSDPAHARQWLRPGGRRQNTRPKTDDPDRLSIVTHHMLRGR